MSYLAVDIGGTKLAVGIVDEDGSVRSHVTAPTPTTDVWGALEELVTGQLRATGDSLSACGVGCGGPMSPHGEDVSPLNIPDWRRFPLRERLRSATGLDVFVANDAQALVLGEVWCGAARGHRNVIGMVVSTGVGGGIVSGGRLIDGRSGNGGHIGHVIVEPEWRRTGLAGWLRALPIETARECVRRAPMCRRLRRGWRDELAQRLELHFPGRIVLGCKADGQPATRLQEIGRAHV